MKLKSIWTAIWIWAEDTKDLVWYDFYDAFSSLLNLVLFLLNCMYLFIICSLNSGSSNIDPFNEEAEEEDEEDDAAEEEQEEEEE